MRLYVDGGEDSQDEVMTDNGLPCLDLLEVTRGLAWLARGCYGEFT